MFYLQQGIKNVKIYMKVSEFMNNIIYASQTTPFDLLHKKIKFPKEKAQLVSYIEIVGKNFPNANESELIKIANDLFSEIKSSGCAMTTTANILAEKLCDNNDKSMEIFGFDLHTDDGKSLDYNKVLVDIGCKLYKKAKINIYNYEYFEFNDIKEAAKALLTEDDLNKISELEQQGSDIDSEVSRRLFNSGYMADGLTDDKKLRFKTSLVEKKEFIDTFSGVALKEFGIEKEDITAEELTDLFVARGSKISIKELSIWEKLSGLVPTSKTFWTNYYLDTLGMDKEVSIDKKSFGSEEEFYQAVSQSINNNCGIEISSGINNDIYMHTDKKFSYFKISDGNTGHAMTFKNIDDNGNIVVSSWGKDYIIDKEYIPQLEVSIFKVEQKKEKNYQNKNS